MIYVFNELFYFRAGRLQAWKYNKQTLKSDAYVCILHISLLYNCLKHVVKRCSSMRWCVQRQEINNFKLAVIDHTHYLVLINTYSPGTVVCSGLI